MEVIFVEPSPPCNTDLDRLFILAVWHLMSPILKPETNESGLGKITERVNLLYIDGHLLCKRKSRFATSQQGMADNLSFQGN